MGWIAVARVGVAAGHGVVEHRLLLNRIVGLVELLAHPVRFQLVDVNHVCNRHR